MSTPPPKVALRDHCSVIYDDTLYVYSPDAFQTLPLKEGGEWTQIPNGISVTGATCVEAIPQKDSSKAAMYVVGGVANSSTSGYSGLQRYWFGEKRWESITPLVPVTKSRQNHAAAYLNSSDSILIYAGSQDGDKGPSSQTFAISTDSPYNVRAFNSVAPPVIAPLLIPWNQSHALMLGGDEKNKGLFTFSVDDGWHGLDAQLDRGLQDRSKVQATIVNGNDGSKVLETFDMSVAPNSVAATLVMDAHGKPAAQGQVIGRSYTHSSRSGLAIPPPAKRRKRDLSATNWPPYNNTFAPKTTRNGFSLTQSPSGKVVIAGGNDQDPLSIFDAKNNKWMNATELFGGVVKAQSDGPKASPSATSTQNSQPTSSDSSAATASPSSKSNTLTIMGIVLGVVLGVIALLVLALLYLRRKRKRQAHCKPGHRRRSSDRTRDDKDSMDFADQGAAFMHEAGGSHGHSHANSQSSLTIMSGRTEAPYRGFDKEIGEDIRKNKILLGPERELRDLIGEKASLAAKASVVGAGAGVATVGPQQRTEPAGKQRSSGWSRYFSGNSATNLVNLNSGRRTYSNQSRSSRGSHSQYTDSRVTSVGQHGSAEVPPLDFGRYSSGKELVRVASNSPTLGQSPVHTPGETGIAVTAPMRAQLSRLPSDSTISSVDKAFSSGIPASVHEDSTWTPVPRDPWAERFPSSVYTDSSSGAPMPRDASSHSPPRHSGHNTLPPHEDITSIFPRPGPSGSARDFTDPMNDPNKYRHSGTSWLDFDPPPGQGTTLRQQHSDISWLNLGARD
ncbi:MAG: hypothetical protein M1835_000532 [Candelina submexicana]|nr:MAG: hypothetical protein M1835_000532 [Candelina submexicana]